MAGLVKNAGRADCLAPGNGGGCLIVEQVISLLPPDFHLEVLPASSSLQAWGHQTQTRTPYSLIQ